MDSTLLLYCRPGYEKDLAQECELRLAQQNTYGIAKFKQHQGYIHLSTPKPQKVPRLDDLIFARQKLLQLASLSLVDKRDRITPLLACLAQQDIKQFGDLIIEHADTEESKVLAKFCRKLSVPLRTKLRQNKILSAKPDRRLPALHLFFHDFEFCEICRSFIKDSSPLNMGIMRLKFPSDAPSRSTLKLEEAMLHFMNDTQRSSLLTKDMDAVDLGACPGGWTYQLVHRGLKVQAVDNGEIDDKLMQTGRVKHFAHDGFSYKPQSGFVDWIVCDMIESPHRVADLIADWLINNHANASIFNLKLPMKQRFDIVDSILDKFQQRVSAHFSIHLAAKHLYHDRDEITVFVLKNPQLYEFFVN